MPLQRGKLTMLANEFGSFVAQTTYERLPVAVVDAVKLRVLDLLAAALAGYHFNRHASLLPVFDGTGCSTMWGGGNSLPLRDAVLLNSFMSHALYLDDGSRFAGGHPSSVVIPAALTLAEREHADGRRLIAAVAVGYDVFLRLGRVIYPPAVRRGFQCTSLLGAVSSAATCSNLLGFSGECAKNALSIACVLGLGLKESSKSSQSQPIQVARSCEGGVMATLYAAQGAQGADSMFERGFLKAFADNPPMDGIVDGLGTAFRLFETYTKVHGGCRGNHAPVDVLQDVVRKHGIQTERIAGIAVSVDSVTYAAEIHEPANGNQAQFSVRFAVASALLNGDASVFRYTDAALADTRMRNLMRRIRVEVDTRFDADYPNKRPASVRITLTDGHCVEGQIDNARGEPELPFDASAIEDKFLTLTRDILPQGGGRVRDLVMRLETLDDSAILVRELVA